MAGPLEYRGEREATAAGGERRMRLLGCARCALSCREAQNAVPVVVVAVVEVVVVGRGCTCFT